MLTALVYPTEDHKEGVLPIDISLEEDQDFTTGGIKSVGLFLDEKIFNHVNKITAAVHYSFYDKCSKEIRHNQVKDTDENNDPLIFTRNDATKFIKKRLRTGTALYKCFGEFRDPVAIIDKVSLTFYMDRDNNDEFKSMDSICGLRVTLDTRATGGYHPTKTALALMAVS